MGASGGRSVGVTLSAFVAEPARLQQALAGCQEEAPATVLRQLVAQGLDTLPLPGRGKTLARWQALASVGAHDLSLAKLYEGHTDALAILRADPVTANIPVIAVTANAMPRDKLHGAAAGFFRYVTKPIEVVELNAAIDAALSAAPKQPNG